MPHPRRVFVFAARVGSHEPHKPVILTLSRSEEPAFIILIACQPLSLRFNGAVLRDPAIDAWMQRHHDELGDLARHWFEVMRACGDEVRELLHDGCPTACLGDVPFAYVNAFTAHVNVGFFQGASLPDPARLLEGNGKCMRHVKLKPGTPTDAAALTTLIATAWQDIKNRVENG